MRLTLSGTRLMACSVSMRSAVPRTPKLPEVAALVKILEQNPFGSLVLLVILAMALFAWVAR